MQSSATISGSWSRQGRNEGGRVLYVQGNPANLIFAGTFCTLTPGADTQPVDPGGNARPLPANGRAVAVHAGRTAAALLELPAAATRDACGAELPPVMWLTLGLLATDGLVLQACLEALDVFTSCWCCKNLLRK